MRAGQRAAAIMSLIQSARMNGHDPYAYLKDVLTRLPTHKASQIEEPHRWQRRRLSVKLALGLMSRMGFAVHLR